MYIMFCNKGMVRADPPPSYGQRPYFDPSLTQLFFKTSFYNWKP